jgi:iron complex transport system substrate-binding protein
VTCCDKKFELPDVSWKSFVFFVWRILSVTCDGLANGGARLDLKYLIVFILSCVGLFCANSGMASVEGKGQIPKRIVSLSPITTENIYLLGAEDRLVGNTMYCVRPEAAKNKPKVGSLMEASVEKIISLKPDVVMASGLTPPLLIRQLRSSGIVVIKNEQPKSLKESCVQFLELGRRLGVEKRANEIVEEVWDEVADISKAVSGFPPQKVLLQIGSQPLFAAIPGSFTEDFITLANGENVVGDQVNGVFNREKVISKNPDLILIAIMGSEAGIAGQEKRKWLKFTTINAVQKERVYIVDPDVSCSPSPVTFTKTLRLIAGYIHPQAKLGKSDYF